MNTFGMEVGKRYRIVYKRFGRVNDECVAEFVGTSEERNELLVSLRPVAGTSAFRPSQIVAADATDDPCRMPRRSPNQDAPIDRLDEATGQGRR